MFKVEIVSRPYNPRIVFDGFDTLAQAVKFAMEEIDKHHYIQVSDLDHVYCIFFLNHSLDRSSGSKEVDHE